MALSYLFHPVPLFFLSSAIVTVTAGFTDRGSTRRYLALGILFLIALIFPFSLTQTAGTTGWAGRVPAGAVLWNCVTIFDRLILRNWDYNHYGHIEDDKSTAKNERPPKKDSQFPGSRMDFGSQVSSLARGTGRFWQVRNVPDFSVESPDLVPTAGAFLFVQVATVVATYYVNNLTVVATIHQDPQLLASERIPLWTRLGDVTALETRVRVIATLGYWLVQYCNMQFFYSFFSLIGVASNPKDIPSWRPLFGSFRDAYTVRNFWGKTWHQNLRAGLEGVSNFLTHDVFQMPSHGLLQRYTKIFFSFALSGLMHVFADMGGGLSMRQSGAMQFFCIQALGIMIEDGVQGAFNKGFKGETRGYVGMAGRIIGYAWVLFFLVWTSPVWVFPATLQMREEDALLSLSAVKPLFSWR